MAHLLFTHVQWEKMAKQPDYVFWTHGMVEIYQQGLARQAP